VTLDRQLPVDEFGNLRFANAYLPAADGRNELWVPLAEKTYAQFNESGWIGLDGTNSYNGIGSAVDADANTGGLNGVFPANILTQLTSSGASSSSTSGSKFADFKAAFDAGKAVVVCSKQAPVSDQVVGNHAYMMVGYDATHHTVKLRNPWGEGYDEPAELTVTIAFLKANFDSWQAAKA
jgi:hypothetical protein